MLLIDTHRTDTDIEPFKSVYETFSKLGVAVPVPLKLMSASAPLFKGYVAFLAHYKDHMDLRVKLRTAIRYHVASVSRFEACVEFNENALTMLGMSSNIEGLAAKMPVSSLPEEEQRILSFVSDALFRPRLIDRRRVEQMKKTGISEQTLFDAVVHGGLLLMMGPLVAAFSDEAHINEK